MAEDKQRIDMVMRAVNALRNSGQKSTTQGYSSGGFPPHPNTPFGNRTESPQVMEVQEIAEQKLPDGRTLEVEQKNNGEMVVEIETEDEMMEQEEEQYSDEQFYAHFIAKTPEQRRQMMDYLAQLQMMP